MIAHSAEQNAAVNPETAVPAQGRYPTVWGMDPIQLHDHFWAARGVSVVRLGERQEIPRDAELYLLTDARTLTIFRLAPLIDTLSWVQPAVMFLRLIVRSEQGYRETVVTNSEGQFVRFRRLYGGMLPQLTRLALTRDPRIAFAWQRSSDARVAWKRLRSEARSACREIATVTGRAYDRSSDSEVARFVSDLVRYWKQPSTTVSDLTRLTGAVWARQGTPLSSDARFIGPVWVGAGRSVEPGATVLGPAVLWDDPALRPCANSVRWSELEPAKVLATARQRSRRFHGRGLYGKRLFDILFAAVVLAVTLPFYPLVMLAIWLEDGRPFFFIHRRETRGGREFPCIKFRSMRRDAQAIKAELERQNQADGPQFYIARDPRLTHTGELLRKTNIDELPQFINVLLGHMSVVGPRPSPRSENQFSPVWREARLSVRAGITGLWQVSRTRRPGLDFQEWIKYDLDYVQHMNWRLDVGIIIKTVRVIFRG